MRRAALLAALAGCGRPISNASFYEDAAFVRAAPTSADLAVPAWVAEAPAGANPMLDAALAAADEYGVLTGGLGACGDAMRATPPSTRAADARAWEGLTVAWNDATGVHVMYVDVAAVRLDGVVTVEIAAADELAGPVTIVADGYVLPDGPGHLEVPQDDDVLTLDWAATDDARSVQATLGDGVVVRDGWALQDDAFTFADAFELTTDGETWPGLATVVHGEAGGRATGELWTDDATLAFGACWAADGTGTYLGGDPGVAAIGDASGCPPE